MEMIQEEERIWGTIGWEKEGKADVFAVSCTCADMHTHTYVHAHTRTHTHTHTHTHIRSLSLSLSLSHFLSLSSRETVLLTWQLSVLPRSLLIRNWQFLTLILRCWPICIQRTCSKQNRKDIQIINCIRWNLMWMIPFRLIVDVAMRKVCSANCILLTHFWLILFIDRWGTFLPVCIPCDQLCSVEHLLTEYGDLFEWRRQFFKTVTGDVVLWVFSGQ